MQENKDLVLDWEMQPSGVWIGTSGNAPVGMVGPSQRGGFEWRLRIVAGDVASSFGRETTAALGREAADAQWSAWLTAHGLVQQKPAPAAPAPDLQMAFDAAFTAYVRLRRTIVERGYHDAYDAALVRSIVGAYEQGRLSEPQSADDMDDAFMRHYAEAKDAIDEQRSKWGSLLDSEEDRGNDEEQAAPGPAAPDEREGGGPQDPAPEPIRTPRTPRRRRRRRA